MFNEDEKNYDKFRPTYTEPLFTDLIEYTCINRGEYAVEIGIGTGQATTPILQTGCFVTAIELGDKLAAYSKNKFREYENFQIENISFEDFKYESNSVDLVYSATAFHWIPEEIGYSKIFEMLKSGGAMALWWNRPFTAKDDDLLHQEIQLIYNKYGFSKGAPIEDKSEKYDQIISTIKKYGFVDLEFKLYHYIRKFNSDDYVSLLDTYSDHRSLPNCTKVKFYDEIKSAINRFGGVLNVYDTIDLYLAKKP